MAEMSYIEMHIGRKVIEGNSVALKKYMHPDPVIDCKTDFALLTVTDIQNIEGKDLTVKNDTILKKAKSKGAKGYTDFKKRLKKTQQNVLLELIDCAENGQDTKEIEDRLEKIAALSLGDMKHKRGLEMAESSDIDMHIGRQVINRNYDALKKNMHPDSVIDCKTDCVLLTDTERHSIKGKDLFAKNDTLLKIVISKGAKGYTDFKERLRKTCQTELLELIVCTENGQDTNEMEGQLAELWYIKHKREEGEEEEEDMNCSSDEIIEMNLRKHLNYISHCIKLDVLIQYLQCYTTDQKSDILAGKSPIRASRKALNMLFDCVEDEGRFESLRDRNGGYPKIVRLLDGEYDPEDSYYVRIVEFIALELISLKRQSELLPHL